MKVTLDGKIKAMRGMYGKLMKKLFLTLSLLSLVSLMLAFIGWYRGAACPPYIGYYRYELTQDEDHDHVLKFMEHATRESGDIHLSQGRWPGARTAAEATRSYRRSLRYSISQENGKRILDVWCFGSVGYVASDAPGFPGYLARSAEFGVPSLKRGPLHGDAAEVTDAQRMLFGLGLFPPGSSLPDELLN